MRKNQAIFFGVLGFLYLVVYRRYLHPKSINKSALFNTAVQIVKNDLVV
jgi:hypothetical protein